MIFFNAAAENSMVQRNRHASACSAGRRDKKCYAGRCLFSFSRDAGKLMEVTLTQISTS